MIYRTERRYGLERAEEVLAKIDEYPLEIVGVDRDLALAAAHLKARHGMGYVDCMAAAFAHHLGATLVTGDTDFRKVEGIVSVEWLAVSGDA